ncbi:hypothetical protein F0562_014662 [Nyssa sinensis]|uniref:RING-type domain-containing protein n=1 Tax=Nyssa sinensis TaxID=561372 RepID=A0A5J4ZRM7_9ASTE|nr:hypothetical protein F0562_014662 [Nyssa sinensis]
MAGVYEPPPPLPVVGDTTSVAIPQVNRNDNHAAESSSSSASSIIIVIIVISSAVIVSTSLYLLLRYLKRHCHGSFSFADDVVSPGDGTLAGGDCAVCLSKFEPHDQLRLLPLCCHAFHATCIDSWLASNQTCPLCRSTIHPTESDVLNKILSSSAAEDRGNSFRIEIGSISRRQPSDSGNSRRSYSIGSFEYIVDDGYEVSVGSTHRRGMSDCASVDKDSTGVPAAHTVEMPEPPGQNLAADVAGGRSWLREYIDRLASISLSSRALSFRSSGRFLSGSSCRSDDVLPAEDLEANRIGEEIGELFRWLSGV